MPETSISIPYNDSDENIVLEGILSVPDGPGPYPAVVICHPHPRFGGNMHNNVVSAITSSLSQKNIVTFRFNFRGVGQSSGHHSNGVGEACDTQAVLCHVSNLTEVDSNRIGLAGYSFGAGIAADIANDVAVSAIALIAMPGAADRDSALSLYSEPILLITGDRDDVCPPSVMTELSSSLGSRLETQIVTGADHFWLGYEKEVGGKVSDFFETRL